MSKRKHRRCCKSGKGVWGMIDRVVHGLSEALGLGHAMIITGFVLGFIFVPLLSAIVFLVTLYWVSYPEQARRHLERVSNYIRRTGHRLSDATFTREPRGAATDPSTTSSELKERFEAFVASEEYRLEREFKRMGDEKD